MTYLPPLDADEWNDVSKNNEVAKMLGLASEFAEDVLKGEPISLAVFGGSGMGKNHVVAEALKKFGPRTQDGHIEIINSNASKPDGLLDDFHRATHGRKRPLPIIMNEARNVFSTPPQMNIMKEATDHAPSATRYWHNYAWYQLEDYEVHFKNHSVFRTRKVQHMGTSLKCPIICMTNMQLRDMKGDDLAAIRSRMRVIEIPRDPDAAWEYTVWLALSGDMLVKDRFGKTVPLAVRTNVIDWFTANMKRLDQVSPRTLLDVFNAFVHGKSSLCAATLGLLLANRSNWRTGRPPQQQDWSALRCALTP